MRTLLFLLAFLAAAPAFAGNMEAEAKRQIDFALTELEAGAWEKAIKSAQSAYRLDPSAHRALVVLGRAYEGLGDLEKARSFLETCTNLAGGTSAAREAAEILVRVQATIEEKSARGRPGRTKPARGGKTSLADQVDAALAERRCADAKDLGQQWTKKKPGEARAWEQLGDALACLQENRGAVRAYREAMAAGATSNNLPLMIKGLEAELASVELALTWPEGAPRGEPRLHLDGMEPLRPDEGGERVAWHDLPAGLAGVVILGGAGWGGGIDVPMLRGGQTTVVEGEAPWLGIGRLEAADVDAGGLRVVALVGGEEKVLAAGRGIDVTAGDVTVLVHGPAGTVEQTVSVAANGSTTFDPSPFLPLRLVVRSVPTGSTIRLFLESDDGAAIERTIDVPRGLGTMDNDAGVPLAPELVFTDAIEGSGGIFVLHPLLGEGAAEVIVRAGEDNSVDFDWRGMPGVLTVRTQYEFWQADAAMATTSTSGGVVAAAIISAGLGVAAGALVGVSFLEEAALPQAHERYRNTALTGDADRTEEAWNAWNDGRVRVEQLRWAGVGLGGGAVVGLGITVVAGAASRDEGKVAAWAPDGF